MMVAALSNFICFSIFFVVRLPLALAPCLVPFVVANCVPPDRSIGGCSEGTSTPPTRHRRDTFEANEGLSTPSTRARLRGAGWVTSFRGAVATELCARRCRSARLWAGPFCSSRRASRSASHESGREGWKRDGRVGGLAAHPAARRGGASAARRARFCCIWLPSVFCYLLRVRALVLQVAWRGVAVGCLVWVFASFGCEGEI